LDQTLLEKCRCIGELGDGWLDVSMMFVQTVRRRAGGRRAGALLCATFACGCATASSARPPRARPPTSATPSVAHEARFPARGCTPSAPVVRGFTAQTAALDALEDAAELPREEPSRPFEDGPVRASLPADWWPARVDGRDFTAYRVLTGDDEDVVSVYIGDRPSFRAPAGHEFRLALSGTLVRGTISRRDRRWRLEALALLPCATPRHVHVSAHSDDPRVIARVARALRSLRVLRETRARPSMVSLDPERDRATLVGLAADASEPLRAWLLRALTSGALRARYPLSTIHRRSDQELQGQLDATISGVAASLWLSAPVRDGRLAVPSIFAEPASMRGDALSRALDGAGCREPSLTVAQDGVALRCAGEVELRSATHERDGDAAFSRALDRALVTRATLRRWRADAALAWGFPAALCDVPEAEGARAPVLVSAEGAVSTARVGRCWLAQGTSAATDGRSSPAPILALSVEGSCAGVPLAPWSSGLRAAGRFDALSAQGAQGACRFTLGLRAGRGWVVSANDAESATGPVGQGLAMGVDRAAIARAVGVLLELSAMAQGRRDDPPEGMDVSVLEAFGLDRMGTPRARDALRWWYAFGGLEGALPVAVLDASSLGADRVRVVFSAWTFELERGPSGGWRVQRAQRTAW
jgi:hypothetical protein